MGEVGINRKELLYELKLWEINAIVRGYRRREHIQWETTRWQTFCIATMLGSKINSPRELMPLPWETEAKPISQDEVEDLQNLLDNINKNICSTSSEETQEQP